MKYPESLVFEKGDFIKVLAREGLEGDYEDFINIEHSSSENLNKLENIELDSLLSGTSIILSINNKNTQVFPVEITYEYEEVGDEDGENQNIQF